MPPVTMGSVQQLSATAPDFQGPVKDLPRLDDAPGTELELLVIATDRQHVAGVDLASGALVRAWSPQAVRADLRPYDVALVVLDSDRDGVPDPSEPEGITLAQAPEGIGRITGRRAEKLLRPLIHPAGVPLLGSHAPAVPFWERRPDHPSIAIVEPEGHALIATRNQFLFCTFGWRGVRMELPCQDWRLAHRLRRSQRTRITTSKSDRLVIALTPPIQGHCHKVVIAVLPRQ